MISSKLTWKQDGYLHFAHSAIGQWVIEQRRGKFILSLWFNDTRPGSEQDMGSSPTLVKAKSEAYKANRALLKTDR